MKGGGASNEERANNTDEQLQAPHSPVHLHRYTPLDHAFDLLTNHLHIPVRQTIVMYHDHFVHPYANHLEGNGWKEMDDRKWMKGVGRQKMDDRNLSLEIEVRDMRAW